jgi:glyoxylase-like metal-dependent hydrolase (beta-lactamase superfamily II)
VLLYRGGTPQKREERVQVAEDVYQVQLPLPFPLRVVNCYLLRDGPGWTVVDTGLNYPASQEAWRAALGGLGIGPEGVTRVVLTHAHPDHYGMAGWFQRASGAPVYLSAAERAFALAQWHDERMQAAIGELFARSGMPAELIATIGRDIAALRLMTHPLPERTAVIGAGESLRIGRRQFALLHTPGHSEGHLALYCQEERLLLCGDVVLHKITPNIGLWPGGLANPLHDFLETLGGLETLEVELALPGHGPVIREFGRRVSELRQHHAERLDTIERAVGSGATPFEVCERIFPPEGLTTHQMRFAMAETLAHLEYLASRRRLRRHDGTTDRYERSGSFVDLSSADDL